MEHEDIHRVMVVRDMSEKMILLASEHRFDNEDDDDEYVASRAKTQ
jgi:hypothetical protein